MFPEVVNGSGRKNQMCFVFGCLKAAGKCLQHSKTVQIKISFLNVKILKFIEEDKFCSFLICKDVRFQFLVHLNHRNDGIIHFQEASHRSREIWVIFFVILESLGGFWHFLNPSLHLRDARQTEWLEINKTLDAEVWSIIMASVLYLIIY